MLDKAPDPQMRQTRLKNLWAEGKAAVNGWLAIPSSFSAETMAHAGWDSLTIDMQHGVIDYQSLVSLLTAISTTDVTPLVRVPWLDPGIIMKSLDAGAMGIICPMINNAQDARRFACAVRYPPRGNRSFGPIRAQLCYGADYATKANDQIVALAMIETAEAISNLDEILATPGIDGVYIGPADLSMSFGRRPKFDQDDRLVVEAINTVLRKANEHRVVPCIHNATPEYALRMIDKGFRLVTVSSDARLIASGAKAITDFMHAEIDARGDNLKRSTNSAAGPSY